MSEETKTIGENTADSLAEQLQAGHRSRISGGMMQGLGMGQVQFHEVLPDETFLNTTQYSTQPTQEREFAPAQTLQEDAFTATPTVPESYLNYAAQLLEQMRGVYSTSWDNCSNGGTWHGGHNHFYNPCGGADMPPSHNCPIYDCTNTCGCPTAPQPIANPGICQPTAPTCGGTTTYYDDCAYQLQKIGDQLNRIEAMTNEMYATNQQLFSYLIEYYNAVMTSNKTK